MRRDAMQCNKTQNHDVEEPAQMPTPVPCIARPQEKPDHSLPSEMPKQTLCIMIHLFRHRVHAMLSYFAIEKEKLKAAAREMM
jgi:hypothetical protein